MRTARRQTIRANVYDQSGRRVLIEDAEIMQQTLADGQIHTIGLLVSDRLAYRCTMHSMLIQHEIVHLRTVNRGDGERTEWHAEETIMSTRSRSLSKLIGRWKDREHALMIPTRRSVLEKYI